MDYVYLDTEERRRFAQMSHEYLIDQLQFTGAESLQLDQVANKIRLNFNHPVKELIWVLQRSENFEIGTAYNDLNSGHKSIGLKALASTNYFKEIMVF